MLAFSDGLFAIAMTLLVVGIGVPTLTDGGDEGELLDAYGDLVPEVVSFFISFAVIGRYWVAHHQFFGLLRAVDYRLIAINLVYLAFIAFLPFPTGVLGNYFENPISVATYALAVAVVSGLEVVLFRRAYRAHLPLARCRNRFTAGAPWRRHCRSCSSCCRCRSRFSARLRRSFSGFSPPRFSCC